MPNYPMPPVYAPQPVVKKGVPPQMLWMLFAVIIVALLVLTLVYFMLPEEQKPMDFMVSAESDLVLQGDDLVIKQSLSPGEELTEVSYEVEHLITKEVIIEKSESIPAGQSIRAKEAISIPSDAQPGRYVLDAAVKRDARSTRSSFVFRISARPEEAVRKPTREVFAEQECPVECNDYNACTTDRCVNGQCRFDAFTPCCGDGVCESGESCEQDCAERGFLREEAVDTLIERAKQQAPQNAVALCKSMSNVADADACYSEVALQVGTYTVCLNIVESKDKDTCLIDVAIEFEQFSACESVEDRWLQNSCFAYARLKEVEA